MPADASPSSENDAAKPPLRVVGVGASAGGLEALQQFIAQLPVRSGLACVVVQHLDPTQPALLSQLLQRVTAMPVSEAQERMHLEADHVYVIPPNRSLTVEAGQLHLSTPQQPRGFRLPVDALFESLAGELREAAVAVVLSGMGSDGSLGVRAVKRNGGLTMAQLPATAQFDAMPKSAIATGCIDIVAAPAELAGRLLAALPVIELATPAVATPTPALVRPASAPTLQEETQDGFAGIVALLHARGKHDFSQYKRGTLLRRIERRMRMHGRQTLSEYLQLLRASAQEVDLLAKEMLIGVTGFFRDRAEWQRLADEALPALLLDRPDGHQFRAWVVGCSTGEEAYTLAMLFREVQDGLPHRAACALRIFATDLSADAIEAARRGRYPASITGELTAARLQRFFTAEPGGYRVAKSIRETIVFAPHDVINDAPFIRLDVLSCRNLLIYLTAPLQQRLLHLFHYSLRPGGLMLLGTSEGLGRSVDLFEPVAPHARLYRRGERASAAAPLHFPSRRAPAPTLTPEESTVAEPDAGKDKLETLADQMLLNEFSPPAALVNAAGDIVYIHGRTGRFLEPAAGKANWNIHVMAREGIRLPLSAALGQAVERPETIELHDLELQEAGTIRRVDITVRQIHAPDPLAGHLMIAFHDRPAPPPVPKRAGRRMAGPRQTRAELQHEREQMQALRDEMKASQEELQASNEELQSTNEELQSTNEELTSSKEEMQSMNEELQAVNVELKTKLDDLALAQSDMKNLLDSTQIATLFLDSELNVRRFTEQACNIVKLREADIGRPLSDLTSELDYPGLQADARETLRTLASSTKDIPTRDGRWFSVRIMPYRSLDDVIRGVVITMVDITAAKQLEARLRAP